MKSNSKKQIKLSFCMLLIFTVVMATLPVFASETPANSDAHLKAGQFMKLNPDLRKSLPSFLDLKQAPKGKKICTVNDIPIFNDELQFRIGLRKSSGLGDSSEKAVTSTLIEEKLLQSYCVANGLLPSEKEMSDFITNEKRLYDTDSDYRYGVDGICNASGMSLDEYWSQYEYYNVYRLLVSKKAFNAVIDKARSSNLLQFNDTVLSQTDYSMETQYWNQFKQELKSSAHIVNAESE
jgi:hypothetical protein